MLLSIPQNKIALSKKILLVITVISFFYFFSTLDQIGIWFWGCGHLKLNICSMDPFSSNIFLYVLFIYSVSPPAFLGLLQVHLEGMDLFSASIAVSPRCLQILLFLISFKLVSSACSSYSEN